MRSRVPLLALLLRPLAVFVAVAACHTADPMMLMRPRTLEPTKVEADVKTLDQGTYDFLFNGKPAGEETFTLARVDDLREIKTKTTLRIGGDVRLIDATLRIDRDLRVLSGDIVTTTGEKSTHATLRREGPKLIFSSPDQPDASDIAD